MIDLNTHLKKLISLPGLSAYEDPVRSAIAGDWRPLVDELTVSRVGSLHGLRRGCGPEPRARILLAGHMDAIGMMVTGNVDGFLRFTEIGGLDPRILPGQPVIVHGKRDLPGVILQPADRLLPPALENQPVPMRFLLVDTGLTPREVKELVKVGDLVSFAQPPMELSGNTLAGHSLDNRAAVAAITMCLQELQRIRHDWDVWAAATVQEEETFAGAATSPFEIRPALTVAIDVTHAKGPGTGRHVTFTLNKGTVLGMGPNIHPALFKAFKQLAEDLDQPYQVEVMPRHSGTDAYAMQIVAEGIPSMVLGIPLRYMHTPVEMLATRDIARTAHLLAQFIARLEPDFMNKLSWED